MSNFKTLVCGIIMSISAVSTPVQAVVYQLGVELSAGFDAYPTLEFEDAGAGDVLVTFTNTSSLELDSIYLNFDQTVLPKFESLVFTTIQNDGGDILYGYTSNGKSVLGVDDGNFDISAGWGKNAGLGPGGILSFKISASNGTVLDISDFQLENDLGYLAGAFEDNTAGIPAYNAATLESVVIPEPGTYLMLGTALMMAGVARRRQLAVVRS